MASAEKLETISPRLPDVYSTQPYFVDTPLAQTGCCVETELDMVHAHRAE
jgi:hypothetical protein